jgi:hypothetical protein
MRFRLRRQAEIYQKPGDAGRDGSVEFYVSILSEYSSVVLARAALPTKDVRGGISAAVWSGLRREPLIPSEPVLCP